MLKPRTLLVYPAEDADDIKASLESTGCQVVHVSKATRALAKLSSQQFDCLVSGYELPGDDGLSLLSAVRETHPGLPVVLFTDSDEEEITERAFDNGVSRFLRKNGAESLRQLNTEVTDLTVNRSATVHKEEIEEHRPTPEDISRAVHEAPIGITMSDPTLADNPLVFVNEAWSELTGYDEGDMLGRNPRILQGPETDPDNVDELATAIEDEEPVTVEIRNYRNDGTPFWNELTVAPIYDDDGELVHYVGFQNDVTDRKAAERLAKGRAEKLAAERTVLQRILSRVNGLLSEITRILVEENERATIEQQVCEEIVSSKSYVASWIGTMNPADTKLQLSTQTGAISGIQSPVEIESMPNAVEDALELGSVRVCTVGSDERGRLAPDSVGARRLAIVPLVYQQKRYGLLGVYADSDDALDSREVELFESIGQMIASGLNAAETARMLTTANVLELEFEIYDETFPLSRFADVIGTDVEFVGLVRDNGYEIYVRTTRMNGNPADLLSLPRVENIRRVSETDEGYTFAAEVNTKEPFDQLGDYGASVVNITAEPTQATLSLELPLKYNTRSVLELLESLYDRVELKAKHERDGHEETTHEFAAAVNERLTDRQQAALETAHLNGYFEWPRQVDGEEVAETMGITRQTFHQHLRAAERKLVQSFVNPN